MKKPIYRVLDNGTYQLTKYEDRATHVLLRDNCNTKLDAICSKLNMLPFYTEKDAIAEYYQSDNSSWGIRDNSSWGL